MFIGLYIPALSGAVLLFTGLRIRAATLRRRVDLQIALQASPSSCQRPPARQTNAATNNQKTLTILTFTIVAYFVLWCPYVVVSLAPCFVSSFKTPSTVEFAVAWLANVNSAVNVLIYSSTNAQYRRHCALLATRLLRSDSFV